jgi:hypothetical protein
LTQSLKISMVTQGCWFAARSSGKGEGRRNLAREAEVAETKAALLNPEIMLIVEGFHYPGNGERKRHVKR